MSDEIEIKKWETSFFGEKISFYSIFYKNEFYFFAKEVATKIGFKNPMEAVYTHVDPEDLTNLEEVFGKDFKMIFNHYFQSIRKSRIPSFFRNLQSKQRLLNEFGIYAIFLGSKLDHLKPFRRWVYQTIVTIRKTGSYSLPNNVSFDNPLDMISQLSLLVPKYKEGGDNSLRRKICKALKEAYNFAKNPYKVKAGRMGGKETQRRAKKIKDSFSRLKERIEKQIKKLENEIEETLKQISSDESESNRSNTNTSSEDEY